MGAPKQKWTSEEEDALKSGIAKHGVGKWRTILKDPEYSDILSSRSNVDLKDKWRNMSVTANGWGSRDRGRISFKKNRYTSEDDEDTMAISRIVESDEEIVDAEPLAISRQVLQIDGPKKSISRLDSLILEAVTNLKEPSGSNKTTIATYIEDQYNAPPNFKRVLNAKLKDMTSSGKLIKVKRRYRVAPGAAFSETRSSGMLLLEGRKKGSPRAERGDFKILTKSQIDAELSKMVNMPTPEEAAASAAQAVAEAEALVAEAEEAKREAEVAEAEAEAAQAFAEAAMSQLKSRNRANMVNRSFY
ncbi:hypothetical protein GIB67_020551 [Kingdonia uniflora]|uniref:MYB transcription factor n=1 Tax=Kingdonia uniflora TaxID=39325 RepID=A0A7J7NL56_9MAGN|nr:hypothetical protein GIB67_020551 [Kingdonia uniflora]